MPTTLRNSDILFNDNTTQSTGGSPAKAFVNFEGSAPPVVFRQFNVSSVTRYGVGQYTVNFSSAFANNAYAVAGVAGSVGTGFIVASQSAGSINVASYSPTPGYVDNTPFSVIIYR